MVCVIQRIIRFNKSIYFIFAVFIKIVDIQAGSHKNIWCLINCLKIIHQRLTAGISPHQKLRIPGLWRTNLCLRHYIHHWGVTVQTVLFLGILFNSLSNFSTNIFLSLVVYNPLYTPYSTCSVNCSTGASP